MPVFYVTCYHGSQDHSKLEKVRNEFNKKYSKILLKIQQKSRLQKPQIAIIQRIPKFLKQINKTLITNGRKSLNKCFKFIIILKAQMVKKLPNQLNLSMAHSLFKAAPNQTMKCMVVFVLSLNLTLNKLVLTFYTLNKFSWVFVL